MEFRLHFNAGWAVQQRERRVRQTLVQLQQGGKNAPELAMSDHPHRQPPSPPIHLARTGSAVYDTECIVDWRERDGKVEFLVKWVSCLGSDNTRELLTNLTGYGSGTEKLLTELRGRRRRRPSFPHHDDVHPPRSVRAKLHGLFDIAGA